MSVVNGLVFLGLLGCGLLLLGGYASGNGGLYALAAYIGWFLSAYSGLAYFIRGALAISQKPHRFWVTLYPVNFGLALLGVCVFAIRDVHSIFPMAIAAIFGVGMAYILSRSSVLEMPAAPLLLLLATATVLVEPVFAVWNLVFSGLAGCAIAAALISFLRARFSISS